MQMLKVLGNVTERQTHFVEVPDKQWEALQDEGHDGHGDAMEYLEDAFYHGYGSVEDVETLSTEVESWDAIGDSP